MLRGYDRKERTGEIREEIGTAAPFLERRISFAADVRTEQAAMKGE
jgi:hypothetical protein